MICHFFLRLSRQTETIKKKEKEKIKTQRKKDFKPRWKQEASVQKISKFQSEQHAVHSTAWNYRWNNGARNREREKREKEKENESLSRERRRSILSRVSIRIPFTSPTRAWGFAFPSPRSIPCLTTEIKWDVTCPPTHPWMSIREISPWFLSPSFPPRPSRNTKA